MNLWVDADMHFDDLKQSDAEENYNKSNYIWFVEFICVD
jgi:hypothetical protein